MTVARPARDADEHASRPPQLGLIADAGLPDGAGASLAYRPRRWFRAHVGGAYNMISMGLRGGATLVPLGIGPSLTLEGGHYFEGNANGVARMFTGGDYRDSALLRRVGYDYANAHVGLELGQGRVTFFIHGGVSYIRATIHNASALAAQIGGMSSADGEVTVKQDPIIRAVAPSFKLGLVVYFR